MKRFFIIVAVLANCSSLFAQSSISDLYKQWMIEDINKGSFEKAAQEMMHVTEWSFDEGNENLYIDIAAGQNFLGYADSINLKTPATDSLALYIAKVCYVYGDNYIQDEDYNNALPYWEQVANLHKSVLGENHPDYATLLNNLGVLYGKSGDYVKEEQYYLEAFKIRKSVLCENHPDYASSLNALGGLYDDKGDYVTAEKYLAQALKIRKSVLGENHPDYATSLNALGVLYHHMGDYSRAEFYYLESLKILKSVLGENLPDYANSLNNMGGLYDDMGNYAKAEYYYLEAMKIRKVVLGDNHPDYAMSLYSLGLLYDHIGDYVKAEQYLTQALKIQESVLGENHPYYANSLGGLGALYSRMGNHSIAEQYYHKALKIYKSVLGENHPIYADCLNNLGVLYSEMGDYSTAEQYLTQVLKIQKIVLGENHPYYANSLNNLGVLYGELGDSVKEEQYLTQALKIRKSVLGENHPDYAISLNCLGALYHKMSDYAKAEYYYLETIKIHKVVLGDNHPDYARSLHNLGALYKNLGDYAKAEQYLAQSMQIYKNKFLQSVGFMTEQQRDKYWETMKWDFIITYPGFFCAYYPEEPSAASFAYNNELFVKGLLLNSSEAVKRSVLESGDTALVRRWNELTNEKSIIMTLQEKNPASDQIVIHEKRAEQLEKEITLSSSAYREGQRLWNITWDSVRSYLAPDQVAIEYMVAPLNKDSIMYCALLLRDTCSRPVMIPLFNMTELTALVNTDTENLTSNTYSFEGNGSELSRKVWGRIFPYIKHGETVYFAPSGLLHQLAIESLPYDSTHTMADMFNLVRLSSTREIVSDKPSHTHITASLYGGIQYNMTGDELLAASGHYAASNILASRGISNDTLDRGTVRYLPGTKKEVEDINEMLKDNKLTVQLFTTKNANEESFKALSGRHQNILHIATHGFYWPDSTARKKGYFSQRMMRMGDDRSAPPAIDPLNRCGLLFAGVNTALSGHSNDLPEGVQDGILTAKEISLLDLRGADLVVLSACETGKGEITGEGVFGLQRAFKQAGVQTIIMSLWPVNDAATQLLMTEFYRNWITYSQSKREAFLNAQNTVRTQFEEPVYWAGFIMLD